MSAGSRKDQRFRVTTIALCVAVGIGSSASANSSNISKSRLKQFSQQAQTLDKMGAQRYNSAARYRPGAVVSSRGIPAFRGNYSGPYVAMAKRAARRHGIPESLFLRLVQQESGFNSRAVSHKGAIGLAQLMPSTARSLGVNPKDPAQNLDGGARYLRMQYNKFRSWRLALAAYNAGPKAVEKYKGVPPYKETQGYVKSILGI